MIVPTSSESVLKWASFSDGGKGKWVQPFRKAVERILRVMFDPTVPFLETCQKEITGQVYIETPAEVFITALLLMIHH